MLHAQQMNMQSWAVLLVIEYVAEHIVDNPEHDAMVTYHFGPARVTTFVFKAYRLGQAYFDQSLKTQVRPCWQAEQQTNHILLVLAWRYGDASAKSVTPLIPSAKPLWLNCARRRARVE